MARKPPHPVDIHAGKQLKQLRKLRGRSQRNIGDVLDVSFQQVQKYETGENRLSASKLYMLHRHLNVPVEYFFKGIRGKTVNVSDRSIHN